MSKPYAWRVLACLPILKGSACTNTSKNWQAQRRMGLYHSAMAHIIPEINDICSKDDYYRFADKLVRQGRGFWHLLCMDDEGGGVGPPPSKQRFQDPLCTNCLSLQIQVVTSGQWRS